MSAYVRILSSEGKTVVERNIPTRPERFLRYKLKAKKRKPEKKPDTSPPPEKPATLPVKRARSVKKSELALS